MTALAIRVLAAVRCAGAVLVARPHGVIHLHVGSLTRSGLAVSPAARPYCGTRSKRLSVVADRNTLEQIRTVGLGGRRFCRTCTARVPARLAWAGPLVSRDDHLAAYDGLTVEDLRIAAAWARTIDETHEVGYLAQLLHGGTPLLRPKTAGAALDLYELHAAIVGRRRQLESAALTDEQRAERAAARQAETDQRRLVEAGRRRQAAVDRANDRANRGAYLMPHERELLRTG